MISDGIRAAGDAEDDAQEEAGAQRNDLLARFIAGAAVEVLDAAGRMNPRRRRRTGVDAGCGLGAGRAGEDQRQSNRPSEARVCFHGIPSMDVAITAT